MLVLAGGGFFLYQNFQTKPSPQPTPSPQTVQTPILTTQPTSSPITSTDPCEVLTKGNAYVPPLYKEGITWQEPTIIEYEVPVGEQGLQKIRGCLIRAEKTSDDVSFKAINYYDDNLRKYGWKALVSAGGVYSSTDSYQREGGYFVARRYPDPTNQQQPPGPVIVLELFYAQ